MTRAFLESSEYYGGRARAIAQIACRECKKTETIPINRHTGVLPDEAIEKKFAVKGWYIGRNPAHDICPDCIKKEKRKMLKVVNDAALTVAEEPRQMALDDRRIIFAKLNEVYLDEKRGYDNGWSDLKVAQDLNVPRKWVETIRSENFGPIAVNPEIQEYITQADQLMAEMKRAMADEKKSRDQFEKRIAEIYTRTVKLEKLATDVRKMVNVP